jgi:two-component system response regulator AgrA
MKNLEFSLDERFYRCHRSFIINREHIQYIDFKNRTIIMSNQEVCLASEKHLKKLKK